MRYLYHGGYYSRTLPDDGIPAAALMSRRGQAAAGRLLSRKRHAAAGAIVQILRENLTKIREKILEILKKNL